MRELGRRGVSGRGKGRSFIIGDIMMEIVIGRNNFGIRGSISMKRKIGIGSKGQGKRRRKGKGNFRKVGKKCRNNTINY